MEKEKRSLFDSSARIVKKGIEELTEFFLAGEINHSEYKEIIVAQGKVFPVPVEEAKEYASDRMYKPGLTQLLKINTRYKRR